MSSKIIFYGGAGSVTGANFMLDLGDKKFLVDCGLQQGNRDVFETNYNDFKYTPSEVDVLFITHSHIDHIGRIPKLVQDGFNGVIYSTPETKELASIMLEDAYNVMEYHSQHGGFDPLYHTNDIRKSLSLWKTHEYHQPFDVEGVNVTFMDAGHVLGSAMIQMERNGEKIMFTGDLGNSPTPLLRDTEEVEGISYMVMESVYGDRNHEPKNERSQKIKNALKRTLERGGTVLIPAFSLERTQVILYEINNLIEDGHIPHVPVFLDSPLGRKVTHIYKASKHLFNEAVKKEIKEGDDIFDFPGLNIVHSNQESEGIKRAGGPKIILAGSGMSEGGRILRHEKDFLSDHKNSIILVGYQTPGSLGRQIFDGAKEVSIEHKKVKVNAEIHHILGYSSHKDSDNLVEFVSTTTKTLKKVFVAMGEFKSSTFLAQRLRDYLDVNAVVPTENMIAEIDF